MKRKLFLFLSFFSLLVCSLYASNQVEYSYAKSPNLSTVISTQDTGLLVSTEDLALYNRPAAPIQSIKRNLPLLDLLATIPAFLYSCNFYLFTGYQDSRYSFNLSFPCDFLRAQILKSKAHPPT